MSSNVNTHHPGTTADADQFRTTIESYNCPGCENAIDPKAVTSTIRKESLGGTYRDVSVVCTHCRRVWSKSFMLYAGQWVTYTEVREVTSPRERRKLTQKLEAACGDRQRKPALAC